MGDCVGISVPFGARSWILSSLMLVVHKLPSCEIDVNKGAGTSGVCSYF